MATSASDVTETVRDRQDNTAKLPRESRRLDTLANLLIIGNGQCVATCIINETLYVTANELKKPKKSGIEVDEEEDEEEKQEDEEKKVKKAKRVIAMEEILEYFKKLPASKPSRETIFKMILSIQRLKTLVARSSVFIPSGIEDQWARIFVRRKHPKT